MIVDFRSLDSALLEADLCIIGAGAAGIALAHEFIHSPVRVLLVESGGAKPEAAADALNRTESVGLPHIGGMTGRGRVFGGTTTLWAGQCLRLDDSDFEHRPWVPASGWPLRAADLGPFYARAERVMGLGPPGSDAALWRELGITPPELSPSLLRFTHTRFSPHPDFRKRYGRDLERSESVRVLLGASVVNIQANADATAIEHVDLRTLGGKAGRIVAKGFVLCCGGIETPRLLLASDTVQRGGLGNAYGLVGRYFQDHPYAATATVRTADPARLQETFNYFVARRRRYCTKAPLSFAAQRRFGLLNAVTNLVYEFDPGDAVEAAKRLLRAAKGEDREHVARDLARMMSGAPRVAYHGARYVLRGRLPAPTPEAIRLQVHLEQAPHRDSRVTLSPHRDALGLPRARIDWRVGEHERYTLRAATEAVASEFARLGLGEVVAEPWLHEPGPAWQQYLEEAYHHMGTTRMSNDPRTGVVDPGCRVHGLANLWVASSAVFPTSGYSNPTLTILALALRLADELKRTLTRTNAISVGPSRAAA